MNFLRRLFGGKSKRGRKLKEPEPGVIPMPLANLPPAKPVGQPKIIRGFDAYGREVQITREQWRDKVLPGTIQKHWNHPEELSGLIVQSLNDAFFEEMVRPAARLVEIDPIPERSAVLLAIVYLKVKRLDDSEKVLCEHIRKHGENGVILTNLAKVYSERGDHAKSLEILWRGLNLDPNQDNAVMWYEVLHREKGGEAAGVDALDRIATIPQSWRAQLWLARSALKRRDLPEALKLYEKCLTAAGNPAPSDLLMQMSGDLGNAGHLPELVNLAAPRFDVKTHGLAVGNNLMKALLDLGQIEPARKILHRLYAQNRPDWKPTLSYWDTELAKANLASEPAIPVNELKMTILAFDGPIWLPDPSPAQELFPAPSAGSMRIGFLGSSAETGRKADQVTQQLSDAPGRFSRMLPLFLAEQVRFGADANTRIFVPWMIHPSAGFLFSGVAWSDADAAHYARMHGPACDYVITTHLEAAAEPWQVELRVIRTIDAACLATATAPVPSASPDAAVAALAANLLALLSAHAEVAPASPSDFYALPSITELPFYLLRLEQLLAIRCGGMAHAPESFLSGEREIIDGNFHLCLNNPKNPTARILLIQTIIAMKRVKPEITAEYRDKLQMFQRDVRLNEPAQGICQRLLEEALAGA